jgi:hypothetical protein
MDNNQSEEKKLKVKLGNFDRPLTFNEWSEKYNVSSRYVEPTKYFQGNPSGGIKPMEMSVSPFERLVEFFKSLG